MIGCSISGGAMKIYWQAGVLKALINHGILPEFYSGTSAGALITAAMTHTDFDTLQRILGELSGRSDILSYRFPSPLWKNSIYSTDPLKKLVKRVIKGRKPHTQGFVTKVDLLNGQTKYIDVNDPHFDQAVLASAAMPVIMNPVIERDAKDNVTRAWYDGGLSEPWPVSPMIERYPSVKQIYAIGSSPTNGNMEPIEYPKGILPIIPTLIRTIDILSRNVYLDDVKWVRDVYPHVKIHTITPSSWLPIDFDFDSAQALNTYKLGLKDGEKSLYKKSN